MLHGINHSYLYVGACHTMFAWHTEDLGLCSINYLHYGRPKFWYCISPLDARKLESHVKNKRADLFVECAEYFRHKVLVVNPYALKEAVPDISIHK